ncbi:MAG: ABC transporter permease [Sulfobacillus acidophilus]|uniref:ABC transporter permease n=1 Tax=Sulfobacillus acidophilus TaxID=53633 RepID=A0A2T2WDS8_9FIRM|nr:MAG: ABC transporter permease [Sulfobacillus acidophilus]
MVQWWNRMARVDQNIAMSYVMVVVLIFVGALISVGFASPSHLATLLTISSFLGIVAAGQTLVILTGGIDLSVPYLLNASAVFFTGFAARLILGHDALDFLVVLAISVGFGVVNGVGVTVFNIPPLIMTLGMNSVIEGIVLVVTQGTPQGSVPAIASAIVNNTVVGIPIILVVWAGLAVLIALILTRTSLGRYIYAAGTSVKASYLTGVPIRTAFIAVYAASGLFAGLAGIFLTGFSGNSYLGMGNAYLLPSIAAVIIGGASLLGGQGKYWGTIAGAITLTVLITILQVLNISQALQDIFYGVVIFLALLFYGRQANARG